MKTKIKPAPEELKKAMAKSSMRATAKAMKKLESDAKSSSNEEQMIMYMKLPKRKIIEMLMKNQRLLDIELYKSFPVHSYLEQPVKAPYTCPVCNGNGLVPNGFYEQTSGQWSGTSTIPETCKSCNGKGYVI